MASSLPTSPAATADDPTADETRLRPAPFLLGAALALGAHEGGHVVFARLFGADLSVRKVDFQGIPFFAITHTPVSRRRELAISSAGFWVQHLASEVILSRNPHLKDERASFAKGVLAFDVMASIAYGGAALGRTGPVERDTRSMAISLGVNERWVGAMLLAPALLDAYRYFRPASRWARVASRGAKIGMVVLIIR
jgi:hypothetical protein